MRGKPGLIHVTGDGTAILEPAAPPILRRVVLEWADLQRKQRGADVWRPPRELVELVEWFAVAEQDAARSHAGGHAQSGSVSGTKFAEPAPRLARSSGPDLVDVKEAAEMLGVTESFVTRECRRKHLVSARKVGTCWQIDRAEVVARRAARNLGDK